MRSLLVVALLAAGCGGSPTAPTAQAVVITSAPELAKPCLELLTPPQPPERTFTPKKNYQHDPC